MTVNDIARLTAEINVLRQIVADGYGHRTIENIIQQLESRLRNCK